jgi:cytochrome d ubiquinol oxidase subunit I
MEDMILYNRLQFAFTITFHYLFPQLTMGLSLMIVYFKWKFLRTKNEDYNNASKFWMRIFALNFAMGVVTGIPMEFQFGTNWAKFSELTGVSSDKHWRWKGCFHSFWSLRFWACFFLVKNYSDKNYTFFLG